MWIVTRQVPRHSTKYIVDDSFGNHNKRGQYRPSIMHKDSSWIYVSGDRYHGIKLPSNLDTTSVRYWHSYTYYIYYYTFLFVSPQLDREKYTFLFLSYACCLIGRFDVDTILCIIQQLVTLYIDNTSQMLLP